MRARRSTSPLCASDLIRPRCGLPGLLPKLLPGVHSSFWSAKTMPSSPFGELWVTERRAALLRVPRGRRGDGAGLLLLPTKLPVVSTTDGTTGPLRRTPHLGSAALRLTTATWLGLAWPGRPPSVGVAGTIWRLTDAALTHCRADAPASALFGLACVWLPQHRRCQLAPLTAATHCCIPPTSRTITGEALYSSLCFTAFKPSVWRPLRGE
jgi:hypothetical protein